MHDAPGAGPAADLDERAEPPPRPATPERHPFSALPEGWAVIGRCRFGTGGPGPHATGCYALAHPEVGMALIDIAPGATPNAEARLRRALTAAEFWPDFPGTLPVMHDRVDGTVLRSLPWVLDRGFAALPALTVPGGAAWIEGVQRAMAVDPAWELPGQPKAAPDALPAAAADADAESAASPRPRTARPRRWGRLATLPLAFAVTFAVGLVSGFLLLDSSSPPSSPPSAVVTVPQSATAPAHGPGTAATTAPSEAASAPSDTTTAGSAAPAIQHAAANGTPAPSADAGSPAAPAATPGSITAPAAQPSTASAAAEAEPPPTAAPDDASTARQTAAINGAGNENGNGSAASPSSETRLSEPAAGDETLPMAPPPAPAPPTRVSAASQSSRSAPVIDRACSQALFRFQQGERLTAAEQNFIRSGCSTSRR